MGGIFKVGQMVAPLDWHIEPLDLFDVPAGRIKVMDKPCRVIGRLEHNDIALVISTERTDGGCVYVIGPNGSGWAFGAFLRIIKEAHDPS